MQECLTTKRCIFWASNRIGVVAVKNDTRIGIEVWFTPMSGDIGYVVGIEGVDEVVAQRYPETTMLKFMGICNFFKEQELVAQAWAKTSRSWWVVMKPEVS